jgi:hypothetical protein
MKAEAALLPTQSSYQWQRMLQVNDADVQAFAVSKVRTAIIEST